MAELKVFNGKKVTILQPFKNKKNYVFLDLRKNKIAKKIGVHVLVARAFIPNPKNLPVVHHKDNNPSNNCVENLKWTTQKENIIHSYDCGKISTNRPALKDSSEIVHYIVKIFWKATKNLE